MSDKKLTAYHTISKAELDKLSGGDGAKYKGSPPSSNPRLLSQADHIEVIDYPGEGTRSYLYVTWPDKCKYLQAWDSQLLALFLGKENKNLFKKKKRIWSRELHKQLLKDAKLNV